MFSGRSRLVHPNQSVEEDQGLAMTATDERDKAEQKDYGTALKFDPDFQVKYERCIKRIKEGRLFCDVSDSRVFSCYF